MISEEMQRASKASTLKPVKNIENIEYRRESVQPLLDRIESDFTYHQPSTKMINDMSFLRKEAKYLANKIAALVPPGREQSLALTNLEQVIMWANAGIARNGE